MTDMFKNVKDLKTRLRYSEEAKALCLEAAARIEQLELDKANLQWHLMQFKLKVNELARSMTEVEKRNRD